MNLNFAPNPNLGGKLLIFQFSFLTFLLNFCTFPPIDNNDEHYNKNNDQLFCSLSNNDFLMKLNNKKILSLFLIIFNDKFYVWSLKSGLKTTVSSSGS